VVSDREDFNRDPLSVAGRFYQELRVPAESASVHSRSLNSVMLLFVPAMDAGAFVPAVIDVNI